jgi:hypothetical protein
MTTPTPTRTLSGAPGPAGLAELAAAVEAALAPALHPTTDTVPDAVPATGSGVGGPETPDGPQAQGDVIVLPWDRWMSPHIRHRHVVAARPVPRGGVWLLSSHLLATETGTVPVQWLPMHGTRPGLGTLVVPEESVAVLRHYPARGHKHRDLRIQPGVYAIRRQRIDAGPQIAPTLVID